jgi:hypothetical protein
MSESTKKGVFFVEGFALHTSSLQSPCTSHKNSGSRSFKIIDLEEKDEGISNVDVIKKISTECAPEEYKERSLCQEKFWDDKIFFSIFKEPKSSCNGPIHSLCRSRWSALFMSP